VTTCYSELLSTTTHDFGVPGTPGSIWTVQADSFDSFDEPQIKAFNCNAQRQDDVSFECAFKNVWLSLNPKKWDALVGLDCGCVDFEAKQTFANYNKVEFVKSVSKVDVELSFSNFIPLQLKCVDRLLDWVVVKIIMSK